MKDIRNIDGKLVCRFDEDECAIEIVNKGCITIIRLNPDDMPEIIHEKLKDNE